MAARADLRGKARGVGEGVTRRRFDAKEKGQRGSGTCAEVCFLLGAATQLPGRAVVRQCKRLPMVCSPVLFSLELPPRQYWLVIVCAVIFFRAPLQGGVRQIQR